MGIQAQIDGEARIGKIKITHRGMIDAAGYGIEASGRRDVIVTMMTGSSITAKETGINADTSGTGMATVKTEAGSSIISSWHGIQVRHAGTEKRKFHVAVYGTVTGGNACTNTKTGRDKCAGVYVRRRTQTGDKVAGGTIVIGPLAHVSSAYARSEDKVAIEVDGKAGDVEVILEKDEAGLVGHVEGQIFHPKRDGEAQDKAMDGMVTIKTRTISGTKVDLKAGDHVYRRGDRMGVHEEVIKAELTGLAGADTGYRFVDDTTMKLPSVQPSGRVCMRCCPRCFWVWWT